VKYLLHMHSALQSEVGRLLDVREALNKNRADPTKETEMDIEVHAKCPREVASGMSRSSRILSCSVSEFA
jgi:hypothetical protein